jgi:hypothetical protein
MDEVVLRAMQKWPNVPRVYGWLRLDRRGNWLVKGRSGAFERIGNAAVTEFIGRNYACDERGRWFFQNGPQRVFVTLEYAPWVYRLADTGDRLVTHTGRAAEQVEGLYLDEGGSLLARTEAGAGLVSDRDLGALLERLLSENAAIADEQALLELASAGRPAQLRFFGLAVELCAISSGEAPARFGYDPVPAPPKGEPDC